MDQGKASNKRPGTTGRGRRKETLFPLRHPTVLGQLIDEAIQSFWPEMSQRKQLAAAAEKTGLSRSTLLRLTKGQPKAIGYSIVEGLTSLFPGEQQQALMNAVISEEARPYIAAYNVWQDAMIEQMAKGSGRRTTRTEGHLTEEFYGVSVGDRSTPVRAASRDTIVNWLKQNAGVRKILADFETELNSTDISTARRQVALARVIDPLLDAQESGFIERHYCEIPVNQLTQFIRYGVLREQILLHRQGNTARLQEISGLTDSQFAERFEVECVPRRRGDPGR